MVAAWEGPACPLVADPHARYTAENAAHVGALARALSASEVRVVTSSLHRLRTSVLVPRRAPRKRRELSFHSVAAARARSASRSASCVAWPLVPVQLALVARHAHDAS